MDCNRNNFEQAVRSHQGMDLTRDKYYPDKYMECSTQKLWDDWQYQFKLIKAATQAGLNEANPDA